PPPNARHGPPPRRRRQRGRIPPHRRSRMNKEFYAEYYAIDRKSTRLNSSHSQISYAVFCLKKKKKKKNKTTHKKKKDKPQSKTIKTRQKSNDAPLTHNDPTHSDNSDKVLPTT